MKKNPTQHTMTRRSAAHDYTRPGIYHITLHVADGLGQVLGAVVGSLSAPDGCAEAPHTALSPIGQMVEQELLHSIHAHYPMVAVQDYVVMPEHLHFIVVVQQRIISSNGKTVPLGTIIAGFKKGCNRRYWELTAQPAPTSGQTAAHSVPSGFPAGYKVPSSASTGRQPLFDDGYCDVMPISEAQLATQRAYIAANPRSRLLRSSTPTLHAQRCAVTTALTPSALRGFLQRECPPSQATPEALAAIEAQLILQTSTITGSSATAAPATVKQFIACDAYGDTSLLRSRLLPVVCHRCDSARRADQQRRCLEAAAQGAVLVSARIAKGEQAIIDEAVRHGFPVVLIADNGFTDRYHPSADRLDRCAAGRLLLLTPWQYRYRPKAEAITVAQCKAMNCVAQALCRTKDTWWKHLHS